MSPAKPHRNVSGWVKQAEDPRDYHIFQFHPELATLTVPESLELVTHPRGNQGPIGSCVGWGCSREYVYAHVKQGLDIFDPSELFNYYNARLYQGWQNQDSGAIIRDGIKALAEYGCAPESTWPYDPAKFAQKPPQEAYNQATSYQALRYMAVPAGNAMAIKQTIAGGYPVVFGITLYDNFPMGNGVEIIPMPSGRVIGGHCMVFTGYKPGYYKVDNSWGEQWGIKGQAWIPEAYAMQAQDLWVIELVEGEVVPPPPPPPDPEPEPVKPVYWTHMQLWKSDGTYDFAAIVPPPWA